MEIWQAGSACGEEREGLASPPQGEAAPPRVGKVPPEPPIYHPSGGRRSGRRVSVSDGGEVARWLELGLFIVHPSECLVGSFEALGLVAAGPTGGLVFSASGCAETVGTQAAPPTRPVTE